MAVEKGFVGTKEEWLASLKGKPGSVVSVNGTKADENGNVTLEIPDSLSNPHALTIGETSYDGSEAVKIDEIELVGTDEEGNTHTFYILGRTGG